MPFGEGSGGHCWVKWSILHLDLFTQGGDPVEGCYSTVRGGPPVIINPEISHRLMGNSTLGDQLVQVHPGLEARVLE